jgi:hypothetical protein
VGNINDNRFQKDNAACRFLCCRLNHDLKEVEELAFHASPSPIQTQQFLHIPPRVDSNTFSNATLWSPSSRCTAHPLILSPTANTHCTPHAARKPAA